MSENRPGGPRREDAERLAAGRTLVHLNAVDFAGLLDLAEPLAVTLGRLAKWEHDGRLGPTGGDLSLLANDQWAALARALADAGLADRDTARWSEDPRHDLAVQALQDIVCDVRRGRLASTWRTVGDDGDAMILEEQQGPALTLALRARRLAVAVDLLREASAALAGNQPAPPTDDKEPPLDGPTDFNGFRLGRWRFTELTRTDMLLLARLYNNGRFLGDDGYVRDTEAARAVYGESPGVFQEKLDAARKRLNRKLVQQSDGAVSISARRDRNRCLCYRLDTNQPHGTNGGQ